MQGSACNLLSVDWVLIIIKSIFCAAFAEMKIFFRLQNVIATEMLWLRWKDESASHNVLSSIEIHWKA